MNTAKEARMNALLKVAPLEAVQAVSEAIEARLKTINLDEFYGVDDPNESAEGWPFTVTVTLSFLSNKQCLALCLYLRHLGYKTKVTDGRGTKKHIEVMW